MKNSGEPWRLEWVLRDPLHGDIRLHREEKAIVGSREFQRLRYYRQLGLSHLIYPGAEHTRLLHSLGTLHVAERILRSVEENTGVLFDPEERMAARLYALTHDVSHIPFGHTLEDELRIFPRHDGNAPRLERLFLAADSEIGAALERSAPGRAVKKLLLEEDSAEAGAFAFARQLVGGPAGADVIDYIDRDSYFCGLDHSVDSAVYRRFSLASGPEMPGEKSVVSQVFGNRGIRLDAEFALESILLERFALFLKVYAHAGKATASAMLGRAVLEARCREAQLTQERIEWMGDDELLLRLRESGSELAAGLAKRLLGRQLYHSVYRATLLATGELNDEHYARRQDELSARGLLEAAARVELENELARRAGLKAGEVLIYIAPKAPGYRRLEQIISDEPGVVRERDDTHREYRHIRERHLGLWSVSVMTSAGGNSDGAAKVRLLAEEFFGFANGLPLGRRRDP